MTDVTYATENIMSDKDMATKAEMRAFVAAVYPAAKAVWAKRDSIHPVFVTAQAALETGWKLKDGDGTNNLFGITKGSWDGEVKLCLTTEYFQTPNKKFILPEKIVDVAASGQDRYKYRVYRLFRVYGSLEDCLEDHLAVLRKSGYADAWPYRGDPKAYAERISDSEGARYATAPDYAATMRAMIDGVERLINELGLDTIDD
jgi:flagellar protein FlgJ